MVQSPRTIGRRQTKLPVNLRKTRPFLTDT